jgi:SAM-dependent methyltransferase
MIYYDRLRGAFSNRMRLPSDHMSILFKLNEYYNRKLEQRISASVFAVGGLAMIALNAIVRKWLAKATDLLIDVGSGDRKWEKHTPGGCDYFAFDHTTAALSCPWRESHPHVVADALTMPVKSNVIGAVLNVFVIEHVKEPHILVRELCRIIKPNGYLILVGPGDICISHGEPDNYFNLNRYAYRMLLEQNNMVIEQEEYPYKSFMTIFFLVYAKIIRNDVYNRHLILKAFQFLLLFISLVISPIINVLAYVLDVIVPFDKRAYGAYMVLARKREAGPAPIAGLR